MNPAGLILVAVGAFSVAGSIGNWDFMFNSRKAWLIVRLLGRQGARIFYGLLGATVATIGLLITFGVFS